MGVVLYMIPSEGIQGIPLRVVKVRWVQQSALEIVGICSWVKGMTVSRD
jgi:hypothetical protein